MLGVMLRALADLLVPSRCGGCGTPGELLCVGCRPREPIRVEVCAVPVIAAGSYAGGLRKAVLRYKERGRHDLAAPLAALLAGAAAGLVSPGAVLVPVPSSRAAARQRGGDHVHRLAGRAARGLGVRIVPALHLVRAVRDSAGLGAGERHANLTGAMAARPAPTGAAAVIVDDIVTSGATLAECVRALHCAGWPVTAAAVIAVTPRRRSAEGAGATTWGSHLARRATPS
jgi:predicted amidophosphoribosyltransferase